MSWAGREETDNLARQTDGKKERERERKKGFSSLLPPKAVSCAQGKYIPTFKGVSQHNGGRGEKGKYILL